MNKDTEKLFHVVTQEELRILANRKYVVYGGCRMHMKIYRIAAELSNGEIGLTEWYPWGSTSLLLHEITQLGYKIVRIEEKFVEV